MKKRLIILFLLFLANDETFCQYTYTIVRQEPKVVDTVKHIFIQYNLIAGLNRTQGTLVSESLVGYMGFLKFANKIDPVIGLSMDLIPLLPFRSKQPDKLAHLSLYNTLLFQRYGFESANSLYDDTWSTAYPLFQDLYYLDIYYWRLSSAIKYQTKGEKLAFFASIGYSLNYIFKITDNTRIFRDWSRNGTYKDRGPNANALVLLPLQKCELDFMGSIGLKYRRLGLELRYQIPLKQTETILGHPTKIEYLHLLIAYQINTFK